MIAVNFEDFIKIFHFYKIAFYYHKFSSNSYRYKQ